MRVFARHGTMFDQRLGTPNTCSGTSVSRRERSGLFSKRKTERQTETTGKQKLTHPRVDVWCSDSFLPNENVRHASMKRAKHQLESKQQNGIPILREHIKQSIVLHVHACANDRTKTKLSRQHTNASSSLVAEACITLPGPSRGPRSQP